MQGSIKYYFVCIFLKVNNKYKGDSQECSYIISKSLHVYNIPVNTFLEVPKNNLKKRFHRSIFIRKAELIWRRPFKEDSNNVLKEMVNRWRL